MNDGKLIFYHMVGEETLDLKKTMPDWLIGPNQTIEIYVKPIKSNEEKSWDYHAHGDEEC